MGVQDKKKNELENVEDRKAVQKEEETEKILTPQKKRFIMFPIEYRKFWSMYKSAFMCFWTVEEVDLQQDMVDWAGLTESEHRFIKWILGFFAGSDGIVNENLVTRFYQEVQVPEIRAFYGYQIAIENVHAEMYSLLIEMYIEDEEERNKLFNAIQSIDTVKRKAEWALSWIESKTKPFSTRIIAFVIVEGLFFSGSFAAIYWFKKRGLLPGLTYSNELISRDEGIHMNFGIEIHRVLEKKCPPEQIIQMMEEAVEIEKDFMSDALPKEMIGMSADLMTQYIKYVADKILSELEIEPLYGVENPFEFMNNISMRSKTNFFEKRNSEYQKSWVNESRTEDFFTTENMDF